LLSLQIKESFMNANTPYNPFAAATQAAIAELTSDQAQRFYTLQSQKDVQNALDSTLTLISWIYQVSEMVYQLGALSRAWCDQMVADSEEAPAIPCGTAKPNASSMVLCPAADPVALLPAAQPQTIRLPGSLASSGVAMVTPEPTMQETEHPVSVTQPPEHCLPQAPVIDAQATGAETVAPPPSKSPTKTRQQRKTAKPTATLSRRKTARA
jgi:hypothetical protein